MPLKNAKIYFHLTVPAAFSPPFCQLLSARSAVPFLAVLPGRPDPSFHFCSRCSFPGRFRSPYFDSSLFITTSDVTMSQLARLSSSPLTRAILVQWQRPAAAVTSQVIGLKSCFYDPFLERDFSVNKVGFQLILVSNCSWAFMAGFPGISSLDFHP